VTENEVKILDGRFGPYVTDGETNQREKEDR
jgi:topoisomerase IA-like protein